MNLHIKQSGRLNGSVSPPGSKSQTIRALYIATLAKGKSKICNALQSDDTQACIDVCKNLGARIAESEHGREYAITIESTGVPLAPLTKKFNTGNSGITTRFLAPILGLANQNLAPYVLDCGEQMRARQIKSLTDALKNLGMNIRIASSECQWPIEISGALKGGRTAVDGTTSQFLSALLLALPCAKQESHIRVESLNERPYADMTACWLSARGMAYTWERIGESDIITVKGDQQYAPFDTEIAADFSGASYIIAAGALTEGEILLTNIDMSDPQGDKKLIPILRTMGADIASEGSTLKIRGGQELEGMEIDCNDIPDLVPTLAVAGTRARGTTRLYNVAHARRKETDRIQSMFSELSKLGANIQQFPDGISVSQSTLRGNIVRGWDDHRTIMALTVAGLIAQGETIIQKADGITKTFPKFIETMQILGATVHCTDSPSTLNPLP